MEAVKSDCKHYSKPTHWNGGEESCKLRDDWFIHCENCPHYDSKNRRTNADRIRAMSGEKLAQEFAKIEGDPYNGATIGFWLDWLKEECADG